MAEEHSTTTACLHRVMPGARRWLRRPGGRLGAAAAVLAASGLLLAGCGASTGGATTQREVISRALVTGDGRHVVVPYTGGGCVQGATLTAAETSSTVALMLRDILSGSSVCPADLSVGTVAVTLRRPLWGRSLTDGSTGRLIPYLDGRKLLRVTYLPPGYQFSAYLPFPSAPVFTAWEREYISAGQATAPVDIEQVPGNAAVPPSWPVTSRVPVGRQLATVGTLTGNGQVFGREITWRAGGYTFVVYTVLVSAGQHLPSAAALTAIAVGLRS
jgi:hypothetical protein